jgi:hypothetical protein
MEDDQEIVRQLAKSVRNKALGERKVKGREGRKEGQDPGDRKVTPSQYPGDRKVERGAITGILRRGLQWQGGGDTEWERGACFAICGAGYPASSCSKYRP